MAASLPLAMIRVIEFSHMVMGPSCGLVLADLGAEVIKIEPPGAGDRTRYLTQSGRGFFPAFGRNKKSVQLDLDAAADRARLFDLIATADVLIENFRPGALAEKGLGYAACTAHNPRLIYLSLKGYLPGPYEHRTALDEVVQMQSGLAYMTGPPGRPLRAGAPVTDMMGGLFGAIAVLAALRRRDSTGRGEHLQVGLFETAAFLVATAMLQQALSEEEPLPMPAGHRAWGIYDIFETRDGQQIFIGVVTDRQWEIFRRELHDPALDDPAYATNTGRVAQRATLIPRVQTILRRYDLSALEALCERAGLPFSRIARPWDLFDDPHLLASGGLLPLVLPEGRQVSVPALPIAFAGQRLPLRSNPPCPGEHTRELFPTVGCRPNV